jgi:hypothetical protein
MPFERSIEETPNQAYLFVYASIAQKANLWRENFKLRSFYLFLIRKEPFSKGIWGLWNSLHPLDRVAIMANYLRPAEASVILELTQGDVERELLIESFYNIFNEEEYAEFYHYLPIEDEKVRELAFLKTENKECIRSWEP